jgi:hypothetical protein
MKKLPKFRFFYTSYNNILLTKKFFVAEPDEEFWVMSTVSSTSSPFSFFNFFFLFLQLLLQRFRILMICHDLHFGTILILLSFNLQLITNGKKYWKLFRETENFFDLWTPTLDASLFFRMHWMIKKWLLFDNQDKNYSTPLSSSICCISQAKL